MILTKCKVDEVDLEVKINNLIEKGSLNELLLIIPTNRKIRYLKKELIEYSPGASTGKINLETIGTFAANIFNSGSSSSKNTPAKALSEAAASVLLKQCFNLCDLKYFENNKEIPSGTLDRIRNVISEYKKNGITPLNLQFESSYLEGAEKIKAEDISIIYEKFQQKCKELNVWETGDIYMNLIQTTSEEFEISFRESFPEVKTIVINGFDEFTFPEIEIINSAASVKNAELYLNFDYYSYNPLIFSHLDKCYKMLVIKGFKPVVDKSRSQLKKFQTIVREELFKKKRNKVVNDFKPNIWRLTGRNRVEEIELISKEIKNLITEKKTEPHQICVAFNLIHKYSPIVRDIFSTYGIPFNLTDRYSLSTSPPVISIINFLEILENDFYYKNIFRALSSSYLGNSKFEPNTEDPGWIPANLLKASTNLKIISGLENWISTLTDAINKPEDDEDDYRISFDKEAYKRALRDIKNLQEILIPFDKTMNIKEFGIKLSDLIFSLEVHKKLINNAGNLNADADESIEKNIKAVTVFMQSVKELLYLLELEYGEEKKFSLKFFLNNIRTAVESSRYNIKERSNYGVQVTTLNEIRGLQFNYLFIGGLCDGDLPTRYAPEIFFSGSYLKNELRHQTEERYQFYQSLCSWKDGLYLASPLQEERQELVESSFLKEFTNLFEVTKKDAADYLRVIYSREELYEYIGRNYSSDLTEFLKENSINIEGLKNSIGIDQLRINSPFGISEYTGILSGKISEKANEELTNYKTKEFSISQLETYAKCPYKYFAERVLKLKPAEEPTEEIEALEMGSLLHNILYEFYSELRKKGIVISNSTADEFKTAFDLLYKVAQEKINEGNFNSPLTFYEKEKLLGINGNRKNSLLYMFLITEKENNENFIPHFFEIVFGNLYSTRNFSGKDRQALKEFKAGDVKVRGKIDRIDINENEKTYEVIDYKLGGKKPSRDDLDEGISLQLPLYMYAAKELINTQLNKNLDPDVPKIYSLKSKESEFGKLQVNIGLKKNFTSREKETIVNELIENCISMIEKFVKEITEGKFNLSKLKDRENKVCSYCSFKSICRIQEVN